MKPLMVSTGDALSCTQAMSYFARSASSPVRYHCTSARRALAIGSVANGMAASRCLTMAAICGVVAAVDLVDLFDRACPSRFTSREFRPYFSVKPLRSAMLTP